jgi:hypothetical protein
VTVNYDVHKNDTVEIVIMGRVTEEPSINYLQINNRSVPTYNATSIKVVTVLEKGKRYRLKNKLEGYSYSVWYYNGERMIVVENPGYCDVLGEVSIVGDVDKWEEIR